MRKSKYMRIHIDSVICGNGTPIRAKKVGRNEPCPCGSGKKSKNCCGTETKYFVKKKQVETPGTQHTTEE
jgi:hypothetical protein